MSSSRMKKHHQKGKQSNSIDIHNNHLVDQKCFDTVAAVTLKTKGTTTAYKFLVKMAVADLCTACFFSRSLGKFFPLLFQATILWF